MQNEIVQIKGCCEHCGFPYKGELALNNGTFPIIKCPNCNCGTYNFDEAAIVEGQERTEDFHFDYVESSFEIIA